MDSLKNHTNDRCEENPLTNEQEREKADPEIVASEIDNIKGVTGLTALIAVLAVAASSCKVGWYCPPCTYRSKHDGKIYFVERDPKIVREGKYKRFLKEEATRKWLENFNLKILNNINRAEGSFFAIYKLHKGKKPSEAHFKEYDNLRKYLKGVQKVLKSIKKEFPGYYYIFDALEFKIKSLLNCISRTVIDGAPCPSSPVKPCTPRKNDENIL